MREAAVFFLIFLIFISTVAAVIYFTGASFGITYGIAWWLVFVVLAIGFPGIANIHIFLSPNSREDPPERILAFIRGIGMLIVAFTILVSIISDIRDKRIFLIGFIGGSVLWWGTLPIEFMYKEL